MFRVELILAAPGTNIYWNFHGSKSSRQTYSIGKSRPNSRIKPRTYVRRSIMYDKAVFSLAGTGARKIKSVACGFSSV